jgi:hypothetical protein
VEFQGRTVRVERAKPEAEWSKHTEGNNL